MTDLRDALMNMSERGSVRGADAVVGAAELEVGHHVLREGAVAVHPTHVWRRRIGRALAVATAVSVLAAGATVVYVRHKLDEVTTVHFGGALIETAALDTPMNVLVVGSDGRADVEGARADTIIVVRIDPATKRMSMLSVPRDLWVPIAGTGRSQRVNTALQHGPDALIRTVRDLLGIPIHHYVEIDFEGFQQLVDVVGGVDVPFDAPTRDALTGLNITTAGCVRLDGAQALALVRSRHTQQLVDGKWQTDPTGDLGRIRRQQQFLLQVASKSGSARNPLTLNRLLDVVVDQVRVDSGLDASHLLRLARQLGSLDAQEIVGATVPGAVTTIQGAAVLLPDENSTKAAVDALVGTAEPTSVTSGPAAASPPTPPRPACP